MIAAAITAIAAWTGSTLVLSRLPWFRRDSLIARLRPFATASPAAATTAGVTAETLRDVLTPLARAAGDRLARLFGVDDDLGLRLERLQSPLDVNAFRLRQVGWSTLAFSLGSTVAATLRPPPPLTLLFVAGSPLLAFLVLEQRVTAASARWQRRVFLELPVVAEQLATLLSAGFSLGSAVNRMADRGHGACAAELARVGARIRHGLTEHDALTEWARRAAVPAVDRLVAVLALERDAADLGLLIEAEARAVRRDVHRQAIEVMEQRAQQVWVPVTIATLVPGVVFMAIPFIDALRVFAGS